MHTATYKWVKNFLCFLLFHTYFFSSQLIDLTGQFESFCLLPDIACVMQTDADVCLSSDQYQPKRLFSSALIFIPFLLVSLNHLPHSFSFSQSIFNTTTVCVQCNPWPGYLTSIGKCSRHHVLLLFYSTQCNDCNQSSCLWSVSAEHSCALLMSSPLPYALTTLRYISSQLFPLYIKCFGLSVCPLMTGTSGVLLRSDILIWEQLWTVN